MKDHYISYILEEYLADGNFDASFGDGWIDESELDDLIPRTCDYAFAEYGIDARGMYLDQVAAIFEGLKGHKGIATQGDEYAGYWYKLRQPQKNGYVIELRNKNPATSVISALGEEALRRALNKIVAEDGLRSMEEKWAANAELEASRGGGVEDNITKILSAGPAPEFFRSNANQEKFVALAEKTAEDIALSKLSNNDKAQAHGYLTAAKALAEVPDPPVDIIWNILSRANNIAGIGSFFLALLALIAMVL